MNRRSFLSTLPLLASGCVHTPPIFTPNPSILLGVNAGFERLTPFYLSLLSQSKRLALRVPIHSRSEAELALQALQPYPNLSLLLLVEKPDLPLISSLSSFRGGQLSAIELGNELDLLGLSLYEFADFTTSAIDILTRAKWEADIITGGIYTVDASSLRYASFMLDNLPENCIFGVHLYGDSSTPTFAKLQSAANTHRVAVTEFGMPSRNASEDAAQLSYLQEKINSFTSFGASYAIAYQLVSGPSTSNLDNFGLLRFDNSRKPGFAVLA